VPLDVFDIWACGEEFSVFYEWIVRFVPME